MPKTKKKKQPVYKKFIMPTLVGIIVVLAVVNIVFGVKLHNKERLNPAVNVGLGGLAYTTEGGKTVANTNPLVTSLKTFLTAAAYKDITLGCTSSYYMVTAYTSDDHQVLLRYGCPYPNASMYAVYTSSNWQLISPTDEFDAFGIPLCSYVEQYGISGAIAPVCLNKPSLAAAGAPPAYEVR